MAKWIHETELWGIYLYFGFMTTNVKRFRASWGDIKNTLPLSWIDFALTLASADTARKYEISIKKIF